MEHATNGDDIYHQMTKYSVEKPIQVTCIFEDSDSDDIEEPARRTSSQNENTNSAKPQLNAQSLNGNSVNHNLDDNESNVELLKLLTSNQREQNRTNRKEQSYDNSHLWQLINCTNNIPDYKKLTSNERKQFISLLDLVAENLITITKYYHYININYEMYHNARETYLGYMKYYFDQSYSVLVSVFLPQENNDIFISNFVNRTIAIANSKSWYHYMTTETLTAFVRNMINWAKHKMKYQEATDNQLQQLISPFIESAYQHVPSSSNRHFNVEGRQPYVNRSPLAPVVPPAVPKPTVPSVSNYSPYNNTQQQFNRPPPMYRPPPVAPTDGWYEAPFVPPPLIPNHVPNVCRPQQQQQMNRPPPTYNQAPKSRVLHPPSKSFSNANIIHQNGKTPTADQINNICIFSAGIPGNKISISVDPTIAKSVISEEAPLGRINKKRKMTDDPLASSNSTQNPHVNNHLRDNIENQYSPERSMSRDSGFGSPALNSLPANNDNMAIQSDNQKLATEIYQITSQSSNTASGACKVCGSTTENICIECHKEYYCCSLCKIIDGPRHQKECEVR